MKRILFLLALASICLGFFTSVALADDNNKLLNNVVPKKPIAPSVNLLLRDDLKEEFKRVMKLYLAEDTQGYLSNFMEKLTMGSLTLSGKKPQVTKKDLEKRLEKEFKDNDFNQLKFEEVFDLSSPSMVFVLSEAQMHDAIPVWTFGIEAKEIAPFMQPGDFLVIANTLPEAGEKVRIPGSIYLILRKVDSKFMVAGID